VVVAMGAFVTFDALVVGAWLVVCSAAIGSVFLGAISLFLTSTFLMRAFNHETEADIFLNIDDFVGIFVEELSFVIYLK
jgi:hypothetical protein